MPRKRTTNEFSIEDGYVSIKILSHGSVHECLIDESQLSLILKDRWCLDGCGYARTSNHISKDGKRIGMSMHRLIMGDEKGFEYDHINRNRLDNRMSNLRKCTHLDNSQNRTVRVDSSTGLRGVKKNGNMFEARLMHKGKREYLGLYKTPEEAYNACRESAKEIEYFN